jgi:hypothetical protein
MEKHNKDLEKIKVEMDCLHAIPDAPPNSWIDAIMSPLVKITKG